MTVSHFSRKGYLFYLCNNDQSACLGRCSAKSKVIKLVDSVTAYKHKREGCPTGSNCQTALFWFYRKCTLVRKYFSANVLGVAAYLQAFQYSAEPCVATTCRGNAETLLR